ncbi:MAG: hypothetical protein WAN36_06035 [Calditrichia bacterium]
MNTTDQPTEKYQFAIALDWEYDWDFIRLLEQEARGKNISTYIIWPENLPETLQDLKNNKLHFDYLLDRTSYDFPENADLQILVLEKKGRIFEPLDSLIWASDKATMHLEFIANGLHTPYTIILPPFNSMEELRISVADLAHLGRAFIIKPANTTGGGIGVVQGAETLQDILEARRFYREDKYLLQEKIIPMEADRRRFWFRGFYSCGLVQCAWWNDLTHLYQELQDWEIERYELQPIFSIVTQIARISKLRFFSTEIAVVGPGEFIIVDYVNEACDMRMKSRHTDGVPDEIVRNSARKIVEFVEEQLKQQDHSDK